MRRLLAPALVLLALSTVPAAAAPLSTGRVAAVTFTLSPEPGVQLTVEVVAESTSAGNRLEVGVTRCEDGQCVSPRYFAGALPNGTLTIDPKTAQARLETTVSGLRVSAVFVPGPSGPFFNAGGHGGGTDADLAFSEYRMDRATATLVLDGARCTGPARVGDLVRIELPEGSAGDTEPLSRLRLPSAAPVCSG